MTRAQRKHSPTRSAAATRHSASVSLGSQRRAAIVATSDQSFWTDVFFRVVVAFAFVDRASSGFAPPARARRVVAAIQRATGCRVWRENKQAAGKLQEEQMGEREGKSV